MAIDVNTHDHSWEEDCYRTMCHAARVLAEWYLKKVGGDDAEWIDKGTDELGFSVRQLDGFHL